MKVVPSAGDMVARLAGVSVMLEVVDEKTTILKKRELMDMQLVKQAGTKEPLYGWSPMGKAFMKVAICRGGGGEMCVTEEQ